MNSALRFTCSNFFFSILQLSDKITRINSEQRKSLANLSMLRLMSDRCTPPLTMSAHAKYISLFGSHLISWWSAPNASLNIWSSLKIEHVWRHLRCKQTKENSMEINILRSLPLCKETCCVCYLCKTCPKFDDFDELMEKTRLDFHRELTNYC